MPTSPSHAYGADPSLSPQWAERERQLAQANTGPGVLEVALAPVLLLHELGADPGESFHHPAERGAHLGLELAVLAGAVAELALDHGEPRLVPGERDAILGALHIDVAAQPHV